MSDIQPEIIKRIHVCSNCMSAFEWNEKSWWYGSIENVEWKACSDECKKGYYKRKNE